MNGKKKLLGTAVLALVLAAGIPIGAQEVQAANKVSQPAAMNFQCIQRWTPMQGFCAAGEKSAKFEKFFLQSKAKKTKLKTATALADQPKTEDDILSQADFNRYEQGNHQYNTGYFYEDISYTYGDTDYTQRIYTYIAEDAQIREYFTVIALPEGVDSAKEVSAWLQEQGWFAKADEQGEGLLVLPAPAEGWGSPDKAYAYVNAAMTTSSYPNNNAYYSTYGCHYFVGYDGGADGMQLWASDNPMYVISQVYLNSNGRIASEMKENGAELYGHVGTVDQSAAYGDVEKSNVPVPTWFIGNNRSDSVNYWKSVNDVKKKASRSKEYGTIYIQDKKNSDAMATSYTDVVSEVAVRSDLKNASADEIYGFLSQYTRYDNTSVYGNFLGERLDYSEAEADGRLTVVSDYQYLDPTTDITWTREYMVYVPANSEEIYPDGAPVVIVHSGGTQPCQLFFDCTDWWEIADEYGFILVFPHSTGILTTRWNEKVTGSDTTPYDFGYTSEMIDIAVNEYGADPGKVFITGQSMGCFYTNYCGSVLADKITAVGGTSGLLLTDTQTMSTNGVAGATATDAEIITDQIMPMYLIIGEYDNFSMKMGEIGEYDETTKYDTDGYFIGQNMSESIYAFDTLNRWIDRNNVGPFENYVVTNENDLTRDNNSSILSIAQAGGVYGDRYTTYAWENEDGIPLFQFTQCYGRAHNFCVSDIRSLWEDWFCNWSKDCETGTLYYAGMEVAAR